MNKNQNSITTVTVSTDSEKNRWSALASKMRCSPIPDSELPFNIGLYTNRIALSRILLIEKIYRMIVPVHGVVMEFGVRWGQNLSLFTNCRGIHEPFNHNRKIVGFDTFCGFPSVDAKDGLNFEAGAYSVTSGYFNELESLLKAHEADSPIPHKTKFELVAGDATKTVPEYFVKNPHTIVALAYFDFDIYQPTKVCLETILPRLTRGSIIAFDELNCPEFPGETLAVIETIGLSKYALQRDPSNPTVSWMCIQ